MGTSKGKRWSWGSSSARDWGRRWRTWTPSPRISPALTCPLACTSPYPLESRYSARRRHFVGESLVQWWSARCHPSCSTRWTYRSWILYPGQSVTRATDSSALPGHAPGSSWSAKRPRPLLWEPQATCICHSHELLTESNSYHRLDRTGCRRGRGRARSGMNWHTERITDATCWSCSHHKSYRRARVVAWTFRQPGALDVWSDGSRLIHDKSTVPMWHGVP